MEQTLREESGRWLEEKSRRRRHGEPRGTPQAASPMTRPKENPGSYESAPLRTEQTRRQYPQDVDMDLDE